MGVLQSAVNDRARVICCQNGVENERLSLRRFPKTYGMVVFLPAEHLEPGVVVNFAEGTAGGLDVGCFPSGVDDFAVAVADAFTKSGFSCAADPHIMRQKYAKLLANLNNTVEVIVGRGARPLAAQLRGEALACFEAAGIECSNAEETRAHRAPITQLDVPGHDRHGSSSLQSVMRGTGNIETDYLNGEIVTLGRLYGVPTPANAVVQRIGHQVVAAGEQPGSVSIEELQAMIEVETGGA